MHDQFYDRITTMLCMSDKYIQAENGIKVKCHSFANCLIKIEDSYIRHLFYICKETPVPILGILFQEVHDWHDWPTERTFFMKSK